MQPQKAQKIDITQEYPCPCRRRGRLTPIALTEAFGCNRCQQIFVVEEGGQVLEQLSSSYPYKRAWRWTGHQWNVATSGFGESYLPIAIGSIVILLSIWLPLALKSSSSSGSSSSSVLIWVIMALLVVSVPAIMVWLAYRR